MNIGTTIIEIRKQKQMTQEDFAKLFHVTRQTVSNWENEKSYPDIKTLVQISDEFGISLDKMLKEDQKMVKKIDHYRIYKKVFLFLAAFILFIGISAGIYMAICNEQHSKVYDKVLNAGFRKNNDEFIGFHTMTENHVDYLVMDKYLGKFELDTENFYVIGRKGINDINIVIDPDRRITLALFSNGGRAELDEKGNLIDIDKNLSAEQKKEAEDLLGNRREEIIPIVKRTVELWDAVNQ